MRDEMPSLNSLMAYHTHTRLRFSRQKRIKNRIPLENTPKEVLIRSSWLLVSHLEWKATNKIMDYSIKTSGEAESTEL